MRVPQCGMRDRCVASSPSEKLFGCGRQPNADSGARSSTRLVAAASCSDSRSRAAPPPPPRRVLRCLEVGLLLEAEDARRDVGGEAPARRVVLGDLLVIAAPL